MPEAASGPVTGLAWAGGVRLELEPGEAGGGVVVGAGCEGGRSEALGEQGLGVVAWGAGPHPWRG